MNKEKNKHVIIDPHCEQHQRGTVTRRNAVCIICFIDEQSRRRRPG